MEVIWIDNTWIATKFHSLKSVSRFLAQSPKHKFKSSRCHSWMRNSSMCSAPSFEYSIFISFKLYLWVQWERPLELCRHRHSGPHQMPDSVRRFPLPPLRLTTDPCFQPKFWVGRSSGSLCPTHTAGRSLDQSPGSTGVLGCYCIQDDNSVIYCNWRKVFSLKAFF